MPQRNERRDDRARATRTRILARARFRSASVACAAALAASALALVAGPAVAGPGTGAAIILPSGPVTAGSTGTWNVTYTAGEDFSISKGGMIEVVIPAGWTLPQMTRSTSAGYVNWTDQSRVDSVSITGYTIRVYLGGPPHGGGPTDTTKFLQGSSVSVLYGVGGGPASARAQTTAPATALFEVRSDPQLSGAPAPIASSPTISVVPGPVASVKVVDAAITAVGDLARTTDQDTTHLYLRGYDSYGNSARFVDATWSVTGGIGSPVPASGVGTVLQLTTPGTGYAVADSGAWSDSTGLITVARGAYGRLAMTAAANATAGSPFAVTAGATDADGNTVTSGAGSTASVTFFAYADAAGAATADPDLVSAGATLSSGAYSGTLTPRNTGTFYFAVIDSSGGFISSRSRVVVSPAPPDRIVLSPDTLRLTAGAPDTVTAYVRDAYGNPAPLAAPQMLTLWTDRPTGTFQDLSGTAIFEIAVPAGADSARFRFGDTRTTTSAGRIRAIDADGASPFLSTGSARVITTPSAPSGTTALTATPDTLVANGADSALVFSDVVSDAYGNTIPEGERFTFSGALVTPITDQDTGASGAQLLADSTGVVRGWVRAGTVRGAGSATVVSERGGPPGSGTVSIRLVSGAPSGAIALSAVADSLTADSVATLAVTAAGLHDANGNQVEDGEEYTVATTLGSIETADADAATPGVQVLASSGTISFTLFAGDSLGIAQASATSVRDSASTGSLDVRLVPGAVSATRSLVTAASRVSVGAPGDTIAVTLRDSQDHALAGVPSDSIAVQLIGAAATVTPLAASTNATGTINFLATATVADTGTVRAAARGVTLANQPTIVFNPGPLDHYAVAGPAGPLTAGTGVTLTATAYDSFGNTLPGRSGDVLRPTVTAGGATVPDSVVLSAGAASIAVLPTVASPLTLSVRDDSARSATYGPVTVNPGPATSLAIAPGFLSLTPAQTATVTVTVRDAQGNPVPSYSLTLFLGGPIAGSLESLGATSGGPGSQSGVTDAAGALAVRYRAPSAAPAADSIFARGTTIAPVGIRASTAPGSTVALRVAADSLSWTAGLSERVRVQAIDLFGNVVTADGATVTMRPSGAVAWSPASGALVAGEFVTFGRDTVAESLSLGADRAGGGSGSGGTATVAPAAPAGVIPIAATRDSLTADGRSSSTATLGPVRDAYGNLAPAGTLIGVSAQAGTLLASDASPLYPGLDLATGSDGKASVLLIAPSAAGPDTLSAVLRAGSPTGSHAFTYVPPPSLAYLSGSLAPGAVLPGSSATFSLQVRNTGSGTIQIRTPSVFSFGAGATEFTATLASAVTVLAGATATLAFTTATVPATLTPGVYAPSFRAVGTDGTGAGFDFYPSLAGAQVSVLGIVVTAVSASPDPAPLGYANLALVFDVANPSGTTGSVSGASVSYSAGAFVPNGGPTPALPATIPAGGTTRFTFSVRVPSSGIPSGTVVQARLHATADFAGTAVVDSNAAALGFRVVSAARITAVPGSGTPSRFLRGRTTRPSVRVSNTGASAVTLSRGTTRLVLDRSATSLAATLSANAVVAASDQATLAFDSLAVSAGTPKGRYRARLFLDGTESGQAFADTIPFAPDSVDVLDPALLTVVAGSLDPDTVSAGQARPLSLALRNAGDVPFALEAATALRLGAPLNVLRALGAGATLAAGQTLVLAFPGGALGSAGSPGAARATLEAFGLEDGVPRAETLPADTLHAEPPASLAFVARSTRPVQTRPGLTEDFTLEVRNGGGSPFVIDPAASRLTVSDGVDATTALASGAPFSLAPAARATLSFPGAAVPAAMASQPYRVDLMLHGSEWGMADSAAVSSPDSELVVLEPLAAIQVRGLDTAAPIQVAPGTAAIRAWGLELTPLTPPGSATSDSLKMVAITVLADGSANALPASAIASVALRSSAGTLLAQATPSPGAANPVALSLSPPLIVASAAESLYVEISLRAGAGVSRVALRLAQSTDVVAMDDFTQARVPVVGGGGLPFAPLTSSDITLFERTHGYPNPFHAGREAVLLSYVLKQDSPVRVSIYTLFGDLVRELSLPAGSAGGAGGLNEVSWDGRNGAGDLVRPGVYVARIEGPGVSEQIKVGVLR